ncbi:MAG: sugar transferase [Scytonematopsis contorta HA4267-MV1]|jgi:lipopolysaccharide/colanic/teichoic acid biosynthesis glycosyltransferase|nr:sugar transferase [Scytonematopsis contorta HA4267-MV1]
MNSQSWTSENTAIKFVSIPKNLSVLLLVADILGLVICLQLTLWLSLGKPLILNPVFYILVLFVLGGLYLANTYHPDNQIAGLRAPARIILSNLVVGFFSVTLVYLSDSWSWQSDHYLWCIILPPSLAAFTIWAVISRLLAANWERSHMQQSRWLVLGANESAKKFCQNFLAKHPLARLVMLTETAEDRDTAKICQSAGVMGNTQNGSAATSTLISDNNFSGNNNLNNVGNLDDLKKWASQAWSGVFVATTGELSNNQAQDLMPLRLQGIPVYKLPQAYESFWFKLPSSLLEDTWFAFSSGFNLLPGGFSLKLKRITDVIFATLLLLFLSPLMLLTAFFIKLDSPGPVFYSQLRTGLQSQPFRVYKFRSMYQNAEKRGAQWASQQDPRITRVGNLLRLSRIDELPQIWNVLRGEMSLIGPRPERPEFDSQLKKEIPYYDLRYLVRPGITGWAQVLYPYGASVEDAYEKVAYDLYYIKNYSLWLDIAIVFKTIRVVFLGKGR